MKMLLVLHLTAPSAVRERSLPGGAGPAGAGGVFAHPGCVSVWWLLVSGSWNLQRRDLDFRAAFTAKSNRPQLPWFVVFVCR